MKKFRVVLDVQTSGVDEFTFHIEDQNVNTLGLNPSCDG